MLSKRINNLVSLVPPDTKYIADIGADHGYVSELLITNNPNLKIFASDNKVGPYNRLANKLKKYPTIMVSLSNGIEKIPEEVDTLLIAGMGGETIIEILSNTNKLKNIKYLILSPHNDFFKVREFVLKQKFKIEKELFFEDAKKYYQIILYKKGEEHLSYLELKYGPYILKHQNEDFKKFIDEEINKREKLIEKSNIIQSRIEELKIEIKEFKSL